MPDDPVARGDWEEALQRFFERPVAVVLIKLSFAQDAQAVADMLAIGLQDAEYFIRGKLRPGAEVICRALRSGEANELIAGQIARLREQMENES